MTRLDDRAGDPERTAGEKAPWREVAVPSEHGGWSLTAEPVVLGLVVAWSWPGLALGLAALLAFVARTPLKIVLVDRFRHRWLERSRLAARIAAVELLTIVALALFAAAGASNRWFWVPLAIAAPLIGIELWFDMRSRSRRLLPELAGTIGIGSVVASIVLVAGEGGDLAIGLWTVVSARAVAAIPYARIQVFRAHGRAVRLWHSDLPQLVAVVAVTLAWLLGAIPVAPVVALLAVAVFNVIDVRRPARRVVVIGIQQTIVGVAITVVTAGSVLIS